MHCLHRLLPSIPHSKLHIVRCPPPKGLRPARGFFFFILAKQQHPTCRYPGPNRFIYTAMGLRLCVRALVFIPHKSITIAIVSIRLWVSARLRSQQQFSKLYTSTIDLLNQCVWCASFNNKNGFGWYTSHNITHSNTKSQNHFIHASLSINTIRENGSISVYPWSNDV